MDSFTEEVEYTRIKILYCALTVKGIEEDADVEVMAYSVELLFRKISCKRNNTHLEGRKMPRFILPGFI